MIIDAAMHHNLPTACYIEPVSVSLTEIMTRYVHNDSTDILVLYFGASLTFKICVKRSKGDN